MIQDSNGKQGWQKDGLLLDTSKEAPGFQNYQREGHLVPWFQRVLHFLQSCAARAETFFISERLLTMPCLG